MAMNINVKFEGAMEKIVQGVISQGYASTKTDALRLGMLMLNDKHRVLEAMEDAERIKRLDARMEQIERGEVKLMPASNLYKILDRKIKEHEKSLKNKKTTGR